jgi:iron-sulfur cluster assembly protein
MERGRRLTTIRTVTIMMMKANGVELLFLLILGAFLDLSTSFVPSTTTQRRPSFIVLHSSSETLAPPQVGTEPDDPVVLIKPSAMDRLKELKDKQQVETLVLRMGVRNGGCSGLSYVMDFSSEDDIQEGDAVDEYPGIKCVVDAKSLLYLYGLELDYSDSLIGGGFKFFNPNAEESCGCGSSFGV